MTKKFGLGVGIFAVLVAAAMFLACSDEGGSPTGNAIPGTDTDYVIVQGYVYAGDPPEILYEAAVYRNCASCGAFIGADLTDHAFKYHIIRQDTGSEHNGHNLYGYAVHPVLGQSRDVWIYNFNSANIPYERDIYYQ